MIKIICVGKIKEKYLSDAIEEYIKRISKYSKLEIIEVKDSTTDDINKNIDQEKEQILRYIDYVITLDIEGEEISSVSFSKYIDNALIKHSKISFIIGGSYGLSNELKKRSNKNISFSKMTFPHQLFRIILLEQIYRSFKIINNETYHK